MLNIIAKNVKTRLAKKVKGTVYCHIIDDAILVCDIVCNGIGFHYTEKYTPIEISNGITSKEIADRIIYVYLLDIKKKFFR